MPPGASRRHSLAEILSQPQFLGAAPWRIWNGAEDRWQTSGRPFRSAKNGCSSDAVRAITLRWRQRHRGARLRECEPARFQLPSCCSFPSWCWRVREESRRWSFPARAELRRRCGPRELLEREKNIRRSGRHRHAGQPLEQIATATLPLLPCDEQSTVMTRSFTSMLLGLQYLAACQADDPDVLELPGQAARRWRSKTMDRLAASSAASLLPRGSLPTMFAWARARFYGLACETALKIN